MFFNESEFLFSLRQSIALQNQVRNNLTYTINCYQLLFTGFKNSLGRTKMIK
ncbi:hypothetical protein D3C86_889260 [compost metagenome]